MITYSMKLEYLVILSFLYMYLYISIFTCIYFYKHLYRVATPQKNCSMWALENKTNLIVMIIKINKKGKVKKIILKILKMLQLQIIAPL